MTEDRLPEWEELLAAERHLQALVPGAVLVGGTAALHAGHRISLNGDHVVADLVERFDHVMADLESAAGWQTARVRRPVLVLGRLDGILTGIRQLRRVRPFEMEEIADLRVPTLAEMARIKAWLLATRLTTRDYLDTVVLLERLGEGGARAAMRSLDELLSSVQRRVRLGRSGREARSGAAGRRSGDRPRELQRSEGSLEQLAVSDRPGALLGTDPGRPAAPA